jgi:DNA polymerase-3 subunit alpha
VFARLFAQIRDLLVVDKPLLIQGQVQKDEKSVKILADEVIPIDKAEESWTATVHLNLEISRTDRDMLMDLHTILERYPGGCKAFLHLRDADKTDSVIELPQRLRLKAGGALVREVNGLVGYPAVETICSPIPSASALTGLNRNNRKEKPFNGGFNR